MSSHLAGRSLTKRRLLIRLRDHHASHGKVAQGWPRACRVEQQRGRRGGTEIAREAEKTKGRDRDMKRENETDREAGNDRRRDGDRHQRERGEKERRRVQGRREGKTERDGGRDDKPNRQRKKQNQTEDEAQTRETPRAGKRQAGQWKRAAGGTWRQDQSRTDKSGKGKDKSGDGKKLGEGRWAGAVQGGTRDGGGAEHGGSTALQREEARGGAISKATFQALGLGQGPGRGHSEGWPHHHQDDPGLAAQRGHCPWARLKRACWESETRLLPSRLRFSPAAWTCPKGSALVPGLGSEGSEAPRLPTDRLHPQG